VIGYTSRGNQHPIDMEATLAGESKITIIQIVKYLTGLGLKPPLAVIF
jgi:ribosomal protein L7/L12